MNYKILLVFFNILMLWSLTNCKQPRINLKGYQDEGVPSCRYIDQYNIVYCEYLQAPDMVLLQEALDNATVEIGTYGVYISYSDGQAIPNDIFYEVPLTMVEFFDCHFTEMPYQLLSSITSEITQLEITFNNFTTVELLAPELYLPFSDNLTIFEVDQTNIEEVDLATFSQFTHLKEIFLDASKITSVGLQFLGLDTLTYLYLGSNRISTIESGAFRDLKNLEYLDISINSLTTLQEEAFTGLENSPLNTVLLYGNYWNCTCDLQWLKDWINARNMAQISGAICAYPTVGYFNDVEFC